MLFILQIIVSIVIAYGIEYYFIKKVTNSLKLGFPSWCRQKIRRFTKLFLVLLNIFPVYGIFYWAYIHYSAAATMEFPQNNFFDFLMLYPFSFVLLIILQATIFILLIDLVRVLVKRFGKINGTMLKVYEARVIIAILLFCIIYVPIRIVYDVNTIKVREVEYTDPGIPKNIKDFKIAFIADVQADRFTNIKKLNKLIDEVNQTNPDLVLVAGDLITCSPEYINLSAQSLGRLRSKYGVYSCVGDHDNWAYTDDNKRSVRELSDALAKSHVKMIDNGIIKLNTDSFKVNITFITNTYIEIIKSHILDSLTSIPDTSNLRILLTHQPRGYIIDRAVNNNFNLFLAGHTHGGQFTFLFPFYNLTPTRLETPYVKGDFWFGNTLAVVTRGIGMSLFPVRYNSTGEITIINIKGTKA